MELTFDRILGIAGLVLAIVLVVLDKAGKLRGPILLVLLGIAALMVLPVALGISWVRDSPWGMLRFSKCSLMFSVVAISYSVLAIWISPPQFGPPSGEEEKRYETGKYAALNASRVLAYYFPSPFPANQSLRLRFLVANNGNEPATKIYGAGKIFLLHDDTDVKQKRAVNEFEKEWQPLLVQLRTQNPGQILQPPRQGQPLDEGGPEPTGRIINEREREWILQGKRIVLVVAAVRYEDSNGEYELQFCRYLTPPAGSLANWSVSTWHDGLVKIRAKH